MGCQNSVLISVKAAEATLGWEHLRRGGGHIWAVPSDQIPANLKRTELPRITVDGTIAVVWKQLCRVLELVFASVPLGDTPPPPPNLSNL